jgi:hypothetical protein
MRIGGAVDRTLGEMMASTTLRSAPTVFLLLLIAVAPAHSQTITGRVLAEETGEGVPGVTVSLLSVPADAGGEPTPVLAVLTGSDGGFRLNVQVSGSYALRAERIGYTPVTSDPVPVRPAETVRVELRISTRAIVLDPLTVTAREPPTPYTARLERLGHYERREIYGPEGSGFGHFISTAEIERRGAFYVTDLLAMTPGVIVRGGGGRRAPAVYMRSVTGFAGGYCRPTFYINRSRIGAANIDEFVSARDIAAIEIYPGFTGPAEFSSASACGVIVILTK